MIKRKVIQEIEKKIGIENMIGIDIKIDIGKKEGIVVEIDLKEEDLDLDLDQVIQNQDRDLKGDKVII